MVRRALSLLLVSLFAACAGEALDPLTVPRPPPPPPPYSGPRWSFRATDHGFEVRRDAGDWQRFYPIGVNAGTAIPGTNPGDFLASREALARWIAAVADLGGNCLRTYTVQSTTFYEELRRWNVGHPERPIFLLQGAWLDEPEGADADYLTPASRSWWRDEIERVVDVVHGNRVIAPGSPSNPRNYGRAFGTFTADVSPWLIGYLIGREMEPYTIANSLRLHTGPTSYRGAYLSLPAGTPIETFVTENLDYTIAHEVARYRVQHPVGFSNWPTLDPLRHETEPPFPESAEEAFSIDLTPVVIDTRAFDRGLFFSYHAYPYYPDFVLYKPEYQVRDEDGPNSYLGYLRDLRRLYAGRTLILGETGIPSSQGPAHMATSGMNHGGDDEVGQGNGMVREMRTAVAAGIDGVFLFALIDEWFKRTWVVDRVDFPPERRAHWLNVMSPEQNFGLIAMRPGAEGRYHFIDGRDDEWTTPPQGVGVGPALAPRGDGYDAMRTLRDLTLDHDEAYLHVRLRVQDLDPDRNGRVDWDRVDYLLAIDTLDPARGDGRLDPAGAVRVERRVEFVLRLREENDLRLTVDRPYDLFGLWHRIREPWQQYRSVTNDDGVFAPIRTITNMEYVYRDVTLGPRIAPETGRLPTGPETTRSTTNFSYDLARGVLEFRIPWNLLHFTDPSRRMVVDGASANGREVVASQTPEVAVVAVSLGGEREDDPTPVDTLPRARREGASWVIPAQGAARYTWPTWEVPTWHERRKASFTIVQRGIATVIPSSRELPTR